jgi:hypothetical protein
MSRPYRPQQPVTRIVLLSSSLTYKLPSTQYLLFLFFISITCFGLYDHHQMLCTCACFTVMYSPPTLASVYIFEDVIRWYCISNTIWSSNITSIVIIIVKQLHIQHNMELKYNLNCSSSLFFFSVDQASWG